MEQPVQVGLVFPRSGQQLFVTVSANAAESVQTQYTDRSAPRVNMNVSTRVKRAGSDSEAHA